MLCFGLHYFYILQLNNYKVKINYKTERFFLVTTICMIFSAIIFVMLTNEIAEFWHKFLVNCYLLLYFICLACIYIAKRNKFVFTARGKRLFIVYMLINIITCAMFFIKNRYIQYSAMFFILIINPAISYIAYKILLPFENRNNKKYVDKARAFLAENKNLIKIGITGSFGKTSCKNILNHLLSMDYNVNATKASFNTPLGIARAVGDINKATDIFIAEMGARYTGDIKELAEIVKPKYAIITGVTRQHLETFQTIENIYREKQELANSIPLNGFCVFNGDNSYTKYMYYKCKTDKCIVGFNISYDMYADNIKTNMDGSTFDLVYDEKRVQCKTCLLGKHNILNILLAAAMAKRFNISDQKLVEGIATLKPVKHRMELLKPANGILIVDDSYNCNIDGAIAALEVLKDFEGRKVVFSQGIVELGEDRQADVNKFLGKLISKVADIVLLCGTNSKAIKAGLDEEEFIGEIRVYKNLKNAQEDFKNILNAGDVLLLQNDLPDNL